LEIVTLCEKQQLYFFLSTDAASQSTLKVTQWPPVAVVRLRQSVEMNCNQSAANNYMYWYRQQHSSELQLVFYSLYGSDPEKGENITDRFTVSRTQVERTALNIKNAEAADTGVYYCAASATAVLQSLLNSVNTEPAYFGKGTKLTVLEKDPVPPKLHILEPSKEEIVQKKRVTLVCLATDFYPDHIEITWKINGKNREDGVKTDDYAIKDNNTNTYSISSRLRLTPRQWFNPKNTFTCDVKFYKENDKAISIVEYIKAKDGKYTKTTIKIITKHTPSIICQITHMRIDLC
ncbi:immunoglobulin lambda-1 light chain-like, partial [Acipenser oxyrinchus oxyrinchus]